MSDDLDRARHEVVDLHDFFEGWIAGKLSNDDATYASRFSERFDEGFAMVQPGGLRTEGAAMLEGMRTVHGSNPDFRIAITDVFVEGRIGDALIVSYIEWQKNARASKPADNGRRSTAVFRDDGARLRWVHLHETWLPPEEMAAGDYDF